MLQSEIRYGIDDIYRVIPHRSPFVLIDGITEHQPGKHCCSVRFIDPADPVFQGHFPDEPILPGVLIIENMAQTAWFLLASEEENPSARSYRLARINQCHFTRPVRPGMTLHTQVDVLRRFEQLCVLSCHALVNHQETVARSELIVSSVPR